MKMRVLYLAFHMMYKSFPNLGITLLIISKFGNIIKNESNEPMSKIDLILHPIRMRILMALVDQSLTPGQIAADLTDVPLTSLYRHLNTLVNAGILAIVEERPVRGTVEKVYQLVEGAGRLTPEEMAALSNEDHMRYFMVFLSSLIQDFSKILGKADGRAISSQDVFYSKVPVMLTESERYALSEQVQALISPYIGRTDDDSRKRYIFALMGFVDD